MPQPRPIPHSNDQAETTVSLLSVLLALLVVGAAWLLAGLLVPFFLAVVLAIAISPVATRLEDFGLSRSLSSLICLLALVGLLVVSAGLVLYQAGGVLQDADRYVVRFSELLARVSEKTSFDQVMESLESINTEGSTQPPVSLHTSDPASGTGTNSTAQPPDRQPTPRSEPESRADATTTKEGAKPAETTETRVSVQRWSRHLHRGLRRAGEWVASGIGGVVGAVGGVVIFLGYFFYLLQSRDEWVERLTMAMRRLGLCPTHTELATIQSEIVAYFGCVSLVALSYVIIVSLVLWAIGVPQFLLWGVLAGLMEFVPYFGPLIASLAPTIVSLSLETWWQPALVALQFLVLNVMESYVVAPLFYGRTIRLNAVVILFGALFFGWIWGPMGPALAIPMMIILRRLIAITPGTPTLDALADVGEPASDDIARSKESIS